MWQEIGLLVIFFWLVFSLGFGSRRSKLPKGPRSLPIIGSFMQISTRNGLHVALDKLRRKYGDVFTITIGSKDIVVVTTCESACEWLGINWEDLICRFGRLPACIGTESDKLEELLRSELMEFVAGMKAHMGDGRQVVGHSHSLFPASLFNIVWSSCIGKRWPLGHPHLQNLVDKAENVRRTQPISPIASIPLFPSLKWCWERCKTEEMDRITAYVQFQNGLKEAFEQCGIHNPTFFKKDLPHLTDYILTIHQRCSSILTFALLYLILHPTIQEKMFQEIKPLVGLKDVVLSLADITKLSYSQAVLTEVCRITSVTPVTDLHKSMREIHFNGNIIPKNNSILVNLHSLNHDKKMWGDDVHSFRPERFVNEMGKLRKVPEYLQIFAAMNDLTSCCPENTIILLYLVTLVRNFKLSTVPGHLEPCVDPVLGSILSAKPYNLVMTRRN